MAHGAYQTFCVYLLLSAPPAQPAAKSSALGVSAGKRSLRSVSY